MPSILPEERVEFQIFDQRGGEAKAKYGVDEQPNKTMK
jgi:hypothetical protein